MSTFGTESFDPLTATGSTKQLLLSPIFDYLFRGDPTGKKGTGVAERWEMATDGLSWTVFVRKGVKFHNGDDLTAKDVKFSLDRYGVDDTFYAFVKNAQERVEVVDDYTVRVFTKGPQPYYWLFASFEDTQQGMVMPKGYFEKVGKDRFKLSPVGTGPFRFVRHVGGDLVEYEAQTQHYRQVSAFKKLITILVPEETTRVAMLKTGQLDIIDIGIESAAELEASGFRAGSLSGVHPGVNFYGSYDPRAKGMPTSDVRVRQALSLAINREEIGKNFFFGKLQSPLPPSMRQNQADIDLPFWRTEAAKVFRYDVEEAKRLLKEAGYANGFTFKLYTFPDSEAPYLPKLAEIIQAYWAKIGVKAEVIPVDKGTYQGWTQRTTPGSGSNDIIVGQAATNAPGGGTNAIRNLANTYAHDGPHKTLFGVAQGNPAFELPGLINAAFGEIDATKRNEMVAKAIRLGLDAYTVAVIGTAPTMAGLGPRVDISFPPGSQSIILNIENAKHR